MEAKVQEGLVMELLRVYMRDGWVSSYSYLRTHEKLVADITCSGSMAKQAAGLLNAQSVHLDVLEVSF